MDAFEKGHGFWLQARIVRPDGQIRFLRSSGELVRDSGGDVVEMRGVCQDVTEWQKAQAELSDAKEQLGHAQKMEALGQLTGGAAHDFNNLLGVVIGSLELLRKRLGEDARSHRLLHNAMAGAKRGAALTQRMLAFGRRQTLRPETIDIPQLTMGMLDLLQRSVGPRIRIEHSFPSGLLSARADRSQFELALINLAVNARDAMPDGGSLVLTAREETVTVRDERRGLAPGRYVSMSLTDSGEGMDEATLARAVEPFFTTKGSGKGTGLGLSMVQGFAEQSEGCLVLTSRPERGTTATIWLPAVEPALSVARAPGATRATARPTNQPLDILVVDDDTLVLEGTTAMIEELGHRAHSASGGREAIEFFAAHPEIDLVITDYAMPGMTGDQLALRLRAERPSLPVIIATGYSGTLVASSLARLQKPYSLEALASTIETSLERTKLAS
jgi:signal transduction histidine kinase/CheY-like chemotaxis protein